MVINCEHVWAQVSDYLENELAPQERVAFDDHVRECAKCKSVLEGTRNIVQLYGDERLVQLPLGFSGRMQKAISRNLVPKRVYGRVWAFAMAAMLLVVGGAAVTSYAQHTLPDPKSLLAKQFNTVPQDLEVVVAPGGKLFHLAHCTVIHAEPSQLKRLTAKEAEREGYVPCLRCLREYVVITWMNWRRGWFVA